MRQRPSWLVVADVVAAALRGGKPVVALESSVFAQGLAPPFNREALERMTHEVRANGAEPATTAVVSGRATIGMQTADEERFLIGDGVRKVSARDIAAAMADGADGATTVAATLVLCRLAGIQVFATGGIGGVHRGAPFDESADLLELSRTPVIVVCAGAKSILDLPATVERLETLGVLVLGYRTAEMPGFFTRSTGLGLNATVESATEIAQVWDAHVKLGRPGAMLVVQAPPEKWALPHDDVERAIASALRAAEANGITGPAMTPFMLSELKERTNGATVRVNLELLAANAALAAQIAVEVGKSGARMEPGRVELHEAGLQH